MITNDYDLKNMKNETIIIIIRWLNEHILLLFYDYNNQKENDDERRKWMFWREMMCPDVLYFTHDDHRQRDQYDDSWWAIPMIMIMWSHLNETNPLCDFPYESIIREFTSVSSDISMILWGGEKERDSPSALLFHFTTHSLHTRCSDAKYVLFLILSPCYLVRGYKFSCFKLFTGEKRRKIRRRKPS